MGFAAGFAAGYEAVDKGRREEEARKKQIEDEAKRLKEEQDKVFNSAGQEIASHNKLVSDLTINMAKAEDETQYNTYASELKAANDNFTSLKTAKLDNYKDTPLAASLDKLYSNARMSNAEPVIQVDIKDYNGKPVSVYVPESIANDKDSAILMQNGRIGLAGKNNIGADGKITGYNPTNIAPIKFKTPEGKSSFGVINGKEGFYTNEQLANATAQGMSVERSKDKPSTTSVNVKVEGNKQIYDKLAEFDNENFDLKDKSSVNQAKALSAQLLNDADTETKKQVGQLKSSINTIPTLEKLATKTQALADNLGKVGGDNMASIAVKNLAPYIGDNTSLNKLASMDAKDIASMLKLDVSSAKVIGDYAKDMSGLSLTDSQLKYYKDTVVGGDWSDYKTKALKTKQFIEDEKDRIKTGLESYGDYMMVDKRKFLSGNKETPKAKQVGLAGNIPVMQDEQGEYVEINGVKKYKGVK